MIPRKIKMEVTAAQSEKVQKICFDNGICWLHGDPWAVKHLEMPVLHINNHLERAHDLKTGIHIDWAQIDADCFIERFGKSSENSQKTTKPKQYQVGIDTFKRAKANMNSGEIVAACKFNIDKYTWREKGQDVEDFKKIKDYCDLAIRTLQSEDKQNK